MKPGATAMPRASISTAPVAGTSPTVALRSPSMAMSPVRGGPPVPS